MKNFATVLGGYEWIDHVKRSLLVNEMSMVNYGIPHLFFQILYYNDNSLVDIDVLND